MTLDRRHFAAALGGALSASLSRGASDRVRIGVIGCGGRGRELLRIIAQFPDVDVVAVSDVIEPRMQEAASVLATAARPQRTEQILDYRRILDRKDIDAVVIATTQHWHGIPFILACQAKKPIYVEKPQRPPLQESRRDRAIRPVGQGLVESFNYSNAGKRTGRFPDSDPPRGYHWNEYLGPAPLVPFNRARLANSWWFDYSGGMLTNWAIHHIDIILWA